MTKVGEILRKAREEKLLTFEDVAKLIKIHPRYLEALEKGDYQVFSSPVHLSGFLKVYADHLGVDRNHLMAFFRREYQENPSRQTLGKTIKPLSPTRFTLTPGVLLTGTVIVLVTGFFIYLFMQYRSFAGAPTLAIKSPVQDQIDVDQPTISIVGNTDPDAIVTINGQKIALGENGIFSTPITLTSGINVLNVTATNKLGRSSTVTKTVVVSSQEKPKEETSPEPSDLGLVKVDLTIGPSAAWVEVTVDGQKKFDGLLASGVVKSFEGLTEIRVFSGNAGSTKVKFKGKEELLGKEGEVVDKIFRESKPDSQQEATPPSKPST